MNAAECVQYHKSNIFVQNNKSLRLLCTQKRKFENTLYKTTKSTHTQQMNTGIFLKTVHLLSEIKNFHITYGI